jgi:hypothetical protein
MRSSMKYAVLNISILMMGVAWIALAGAGIEGGIPVLTALAGCGGLAFMMHRAWKEVCRMERLARQAKRARAARVAVPVYEGPNLRVA